MKAVNLLLQSDSMSIETETDSNKVGYLVLKDKLCIIRVESMKSWVVKQTYLSEHTKTRLSRAMF